VHTDFWAHCNVLSVTSIVTVSDAPAARVTDFVACAGDPVGKVNLHVTVPVLLVVPVLVRSTEKVTLLLRMVERSVSSESQSVIWIVIPAPPRIRTRASTATMTIATTATTATMSIVLLFFGIPGCCIGGCICCGGYCCG